ncbi:MAG: glycosyltransferase [Desulfobulbaceae bacterium]|nr:glycosyltransferase [Desulfobulbaceae bacterium]
MPQTLKVCHIYKTYLPDTFGGLERVIEQICGQTKEFGIESTVATLSRNGYRQLDRVEARVVQFPITADYFSSPVSLGLFHHFAELVADHDLLHYHFPWPFADFLHIFNKIRKPAVVTYHSDILRQKKLKWLYGPLMKRFFTSAARIIVTSSNYLESSHDLQPFRNKCEIVPICLDENCYPVVSEGKKRLWQKKLGRDFFLFVGVLRYYKGLHTLLEAARGFPGRIVIVGKGPMEETLRSQVAETGLDNVVFCGVLSDEDKMALMSLCRAVVFPSHLRTEAFGVTLLEGAMAGRPLISTELGTGTSFVNLHGSTGIVVPPQDSAALRRAMTQLTQDDALCLEMGKAARLRFEQVFSAPRMGRAYSEIYQKLV